MVGLSWEDHVAFLESRSAASGIVERVRAQAAECAGHPAVLCLCVGNEIPAPIVRWHGPRAIEAFIERLCTAAKAEDPNALVTYVNYPSTEYLELPFLDLACFNVFLESRQTFGDYVARLHNVVGDKPLLLTEIGLDSMRNGEEAQARHIGLQVRAAFEAGCAGAFVFSWTDDWHRGGSRIEDWGFGLTDAARKPKQSLAAVRYAFAQDPGLVDARMATSLGGRMHLQRVGDDRGLSCRYRTARLSRTSRRLSSTTARPTALLRSPRIST